MLFAPTLSPQPMHIPDGFLSVMVSIVFWIVSAVVIGIALRKTSHELGERQVPLMGIMAAAIFAGQMLNFSVTGGTSGHLLGAALASILLGPWASVIVMTAVVSIQALIFQDGGILALGTNLFNMAIIGSFVAYAICRLVSGLFKGRSWGVFVSSFSAAWTSIFIASLACALELAISGTSPANIAVPAMGAIHAIIGIGEGLITVGAVSLLFATRRDLLKVGEATPVSGDRGLLIGGGALALVLAVLSPLASSHPDGLEWVAEQHGFLTSAQDAVYHIFPDYVLPGIPDPALATILAGIIGSLIVFAVAYAVGRAEVKRPAK